MSGSVDRVPLIAVVFASLLETDHLGFDSDAGHSPSFFQWSSFTPRTYMVDEIPSVLCFFVLSTISVQSEYTTTPPVHSTVLCYLSPFLPSGTSYLPWQRCMAWLWRICFP